MFNSFFNDLVKYKTVLGQLVKQQVTLRYRRTIFGFLWTLLNPLLNMIVIATVFSIVLKFQIRDYSIFLFSAIIPWTMFSNTIAQCSQSLIMNESLIKKIYLPKQLFITANAFSVLIDSFLSTICLFIIALLFGAKLSFALLFLPFSFLFHVWTRIDSVHMLRISSRYAIFNRGAIAGALFYHANNLSD